MITTCENNLYEQVKKKSSGLRTCFTPNTILMFLVYCCNYKHHYEHVINLFPLTRQNKVEASVSCWFGAAGWSRQDVPAHTLPVPSCPVHTGPIPVPKPRPPPPPPPPSTSPAVTCADPHGTTPALTPAHWEDWFLQDDVQEQKNSFMFGDRILYFRLGVKLILVHGQYTP